MESIDISKITNSDIKIIADGLNKQTQKLEDLIEKLIDKIDAKTG